VSEGLPLRLYANPVKQALDLAWAVDLTVA
jgi:hypothetical protein